MAKAYESAKNGHTVIPCGNDLVVVHKDLDAKSAEKLRKAGKYSTTDNDNGGKTIFIGFREYTDFALDLSFTEKAQDKVEQEIEWV